MCVTSTVAGRPNSEVSDGIIGLSEEMLPASVELPDPSLLSFSGSEVGKEVTPPVTSSKLSSSG